MTDTELEIEPDEPDPDMSLVQIYCSRVSLEELRRYMCIDQVRCFGTPSKEAVKTAKDFEKFLIGHGPNLEVVK